MNILTKARSFDRCESIRLMTSVRWNPCGPSATARKTSAIPPTPIRSSRKYFPNGFAPGRGDCGLSTPTGIILGRSGAKGYRPHQWKHGFVGDAATPTHLGRRARQRQSSTPTPSSSYCRLNAWPSLTVTFSIWSTFRSRRLNSNLCRPQARGRSTTGVCRPVSAPSTQRSDQGNEPTVSRQFAGPVAGCSGWVAAAFTEAGRACARAIGFRSAVRSPARAAGAGSVASWPAGAGGGEGDARGAGADGGASRGVAATGAETAGAGALAAVSDGWTRPRRTSPTATAASSTPATARPLPGTQRRGCCHSTDGSLSKKARLTSDGSSAAKCDVLTTVGSLCTVGRGVGTPGAGAGVTARHDSPEVWRMTSAIPEGSAETAVFSSGSKPCAGRFTTGLGGTSVPGSAAVQRKCRANSETEGKRLFLSLASARVMTLSSSAGSSGRKS